MYALAPPPRRRLPNLAAAAEPLPRRPGARTMHACMFAAREARQEAAAAAVMLPRRRSACAVVPCPGLLCRAQRSPCRGAGAGAERARLHAACSSSVAVWPSTCPAAMLGDVLEERAACGGAGGRPAEDTAAVFGLRAQPVRTRCAWPVRPCMLKHAAQGVQGFSSCGGRLCPSDTEVHPQRSTVQSSLFSECGVYHVAMGVVSSRIMDVQISRMIDVTRKSEVLTGELALGLKPSSDTWAKGALPAGFCGMLCLLPCK